MLLGAHLIFGNALILPLVEQLALSGVEGPAGAFLLGVASHHLGDLLPHIDSNLWPRDFNDIRNWPRLLWALFIVETLIGVLILLNFAPTFAGRWAIILAAGFGSLLPDLISHTPIKYRLNRTNIGQMYLTFHKRFHFRVSGTRRSLKLAVAGVIELFVLALSLLVLGSLPVSL